MNYEEFLIDILKSSDKYIVMTAENRAAIRNLPSQVADRFIDTGITEQTMIGMSAGLALRGRIPIVHALASFLTMRAFEFIRTDIGVGNLPVKLVGSVAGFLSEANGPAHQAIEDISIMRGIPNMNIFSPSDEDDMIEGMKEILPSDSPWYVRFNNQRADIRHKKFEIGKAEMVYEGDDVVIITYGYMFKHALTITEALNLYGISTGLVNVRTLKPIDKDLIKDICSHNHLVVTLEDHFMTGGLFTIISELLAKEYIRCRILPIALKNWFKPAIMNDLLIHEGFSAEQVAKQIKNELERIEAWHPRVI